MPQLPDVSSKYGAPMGRRDSHPGNEPESRLRLYRIRLNNGGYDDGGAYWGIGQPLYHCCDDDGAFERFFRAYDRDDAKQIILAECPDAKFYR